MNSTFPFESEPLTLTDLEILARSWIDSGLAQKAGLVRVNSVTGAEIVARNGHGDFAGIVFPYTRPGERKANLYVLRRDHPDQEPNGKGGFKEKAKYLVAPGSRQSLYFVPETDPSWLKDISLPVLIVEGEKKCIAAWALGWHGLSENALVPRFLPIGLRGVYGWRGKIGKEVSPDGKLVEVRGAISDLNPIKWRGRKVIICFDANVKTNPQVKNAREDLSLELQQRTANIYWTQWPDGLPETVNGLDDYAGAIGPEKALELIESARPAGDEPFIETLPAFIHRVSLLPTPKVLINDLIFEDTIGLSHGQPRDGKTLAELEMMLAATTGCCAFGLGRFEVPEPIRAGYFTEEDSEKWMLKQLRLLLAGRELSEPPENFFLSVQHGIDLDNPQWQERLVKEILRLGLRYIVIDPLRAFTANADKGPNELKPFADFLRRFMRETGCTVRLVHHDTKQLQGKPDDRRRPQRASGGGIFSIANCPLSFERIGANQTLVVPSGWKYGESPKPFKVQLRTGIGWLRLEGENVAGDESADLALYEMILEFLKVNPWKSGSKIAESIHKMKANVLVALEILFDMSKVDCVEKGRAKLWGLKS